MNLGSGRILGALLLLSLLTLPACSRVFPVGQVERLDFAELALGGAPNQYLVCGPADCKSATPHRESPVFGVSAAVLRSAWGEAIDASPRTKLLLSVGDIQQTFVQRSAIFGFPDLVTVEFVRRGPAESTLLIYSRSLFGYSDFGVNRLRIDGWLEQLRARFPAEAVR